MAGLVLFQLHKSNTVQLLDSWEVLGFVDEEDHGCEYPMSLVNEAGVLKPVLHASRLSRQGRAGRCHACEKAARFMKAKACTLVWYT
jgi:hypothetical protein